MIEILKVGKIYAHFWGFFFLLLIGHKGLSLTCGITYFENETNLFFNFYSCKLLQVAVLFSLKDI